MDIVPVWTWWGVFDRNILVDMMPGAVVGIGLGWLTAAMVTEEAVRLIVGAVAIIFVLRWLYLQVRHGSDHAGRTGTSQAGGGGRSRLSESNRRPSPH